MNHVISCHGRLRRLTSSTTPSRGTHRTDGTKMPAGSTAPRFPFTHTVTTPSVSIQAAHNLAMKINFIVFLDHIVARTGAHQHRRSGQGHNTLSLIAYQAYRPHTHVEPRKTPNGSMAKPVDGR
ncbi:hypothetical protein KP509_1Z280600 [Ceratopteris richardii]|nr:hypothetical protein KP509_1Z280600 [Ceratopteris richardii]